jgi:hypothetical protein
MDTADQIQTVYLMLFPYATYNYDRALACAAINREFKNLCRSNMRHVLLIIGRYLGQKFTPDTPTNKICETLQNEIFSLCLSEELTDEERAKFILSTKTGIVQALDQKQIICKHFRSQGRESILSFIYSLKYNPEWQTLSMYIIYMGRPDAYEITRSNRGIQAADMIKEGKSVELFNQGLEKVGKFDRYYLKFSKIFRDETYLDFINDIIDRMSKGELSVFATWDDVCN